MTDFSFKNWLVNEWADFGFEDERKIPAGRDTRFYTAINPDAPIDRIDIEQIINRLGGLHIKGVKGRVKFVNEVFWGRGPGSMRVKIHPDLHVEVSRMAHDLEGTPVWLTKRLYLINRAGYGGHEEFIVQEILGQVEMIKDLPVDSPKKDYHELENLVVAMSNKMRKVARGYFLFENIKKLNDNQYIISFSVRGQGLEAPSQRRVVANQTLVTFDENAGRIRLTNKNIETNVGGHKWDIMPPDTDVNFFPTQPRDEIVEVIATTMRWY
jgi:hypothetical protein